METWASRGPSNFAGTRLDNLMYKVNGVSSCVFRQNRDHLSSNFWGLSGLFCPRATGLTTCEGFSSAFSRTLLWESDQCHPQAPSSMKAFRKKSAQKLQRTSPPLKAPWEAWPITRGMGQCCREGDGVRPLTPLRKGQRT